MAQLLGVDPRVVECTAINVQTGVASISFTGTSTPGSTDVMEQVFYSQRSNFCASLRIESEFQSVCYRPPAGWADSTTVSAPESSEPPITVPRTVASMVDSTLENDASAGADEDISKTEMMILVTLGTVALAVLVMAVVYRQRSADAKTGKSAITNYTNTVFEHAHPDSDLAHRVRLQQQHGSLTSSPISIPRIGSPTGPLYTGEGLQPMTQNRDWQVRGSNPYATTVM